MFFKIFCFSMMWDSPNFERKINEYLTKSQPFLLILYKGNGVCIINFTEWLLKHRFC